MDKTTSLFYGALLHDIGKIVFRANSSNVNHSKLGASFLEEEIVPKNPAFDSENGKSIIEQVRFHHAKELAHEPNMDNASLAYITYFADNISAGMDRKDDEASARDLIFDHDAKLEKVFNILWDHHDKNTIAHDSYNSILSTIRSHLIKTNISMMEINSLLNLLEATTSSIPSSTNTSEVMDISLFDHLRTTAAIAACLYFYLQEDGVTDYREALFDRNNSNRYYTLPIFYLYSFDVSGIQDFIYNISGSGALKQLRARSLYLELMIENIADELLCRLNLSRANLLYLGGGNAYLILPNTRNAKQALSIFENELKQWFIKNYKTDLYVAAAGIECSAYDLENVGEESDRYSNLFVNLSRKISFKKNSRYSAMDISRLNAEVFSEKKKSDHGRECKECLRSDLQLNADGRCRLCSSLGLVSQDLVKKDVFVVVGEEAHLSPNNLSKALVLPFDKFLIVLSEDEYLNERPKAERIYTKNRMDMGIGLSTHIWMGDYTAEPNAHEDRFQSYSKCGITLENEKGVKRLGVLRADVDDLGAIFASAIPADKISISRTATMSRLLNSFFKNTINHVLEEGKYQVQVIYSGGDDLFLIGNWSDVIYAAIDLRKSFDSFIGNGTITFSSGIGIFDSSFPIARMAKETGNLENAAKQYQDSCQTKDAIALWVDDFVFSWTDFIEGVMPLVSQVKYVFSKKEKGKAFIYKMVALLRNYDDAISAPRLAYLLARSFQDQSNQTQDTCRFFYAISRDSIKRKWLIAALEIYVYSIRER